MLNILQHAYSSYNYCKTILICRRKSGGLEEKLHDHPRSPRFVYDSGNGLKIYADLKEYLNMSPERQIRYKRIEPFNPQVRNDKSG